MVCPVQITGLFCVGSCDRVLLARRRTPHGIKVPPEHLVIEGPDIGYDGRSHLGVAIDADHLPTPIAEDLTNTARAAEYF